MIEGGNTDVVQIEGINNASFRVHICAQLAELLRYKDQEEITGFKLENNFGSASIESETEEIGIQGNKFGTGFVLNFRDTGNKLILKIRLIKTTRGILLLGDVLKPQGIWKVSNQIQGSVMTILGIDSIGEDVKKDLEGRYKKAWEILHERKYKE